MNFDNDKIPKTVAYCLLFIISIVGNCLIVWIIYKDNRLRTTTNYLVANLAVSDLLSVLFLVPSTIMQIIFDYRWLIVNDFGLALCKLGIFVGDTSTAVSLYSCVFIAIDRYYAVAHPMKGGFIRSRLKYIIPAIWIFSALINSPSLYFWRLVIDHGMVYCNVEYQEVLQQRIHFLFLITLIVGIPLPIISTLYILIVYKLRHHRSPGNQTDLARRRREQQNRKVFKMSVTITALLFISHLFCTIVIILWLVRRLSNLTVAIRPDLKFAAVFMARMSFAYNFFIYVIFNNIYRENVKAIITKLCCRRCRSASDCVRDTTVVNVGQELHEME